MKVLKAAHRMPGHVTCKCGSELEFTVEDVKMDVETYGFWMDNKIDYFYIECPVCTAKIKLGYSLDDILPWIIEEE